MKLAIVIEKYLPNAGGNERSTQQIARRLIDRGHEVTILTNERDPGPIADLLPGGRVESRDGMSTASAAGLWLFMRWADQRLSGGEFDASLSMTTAVAASVVQPRGGTVRETLARNLAMRRSGFRRAVKQLSIATSPKQRLLLAAERRTLFSPRVKKIAAVSKYVADQLFYHYTMPSRRIEVIPNAAETPETNTEQQQALRTQMRSMLDLSGDDVVFVFAAMNPALKGLGPLLEALAEVRSERGHERAKLVVAGSLHHGPQRHAQRLGVRDAVRWVGPTRRMDSLYAAADVTVLPTWYDPSSKVVLESLLAGRPAISTLYNGASQWILSPSGEHEPPSPFDPLDPRSLSPNGQRAGRVIDSPANIEALAAAMGELCDDAERARCAEAARLISPHITMDRHVDRLEQLLRQVAAGVD